MKQKNSIKLNLTDDERKVLRVKKYRIRDLIELATDEIEIVLNVPFARAREIHALAEFQSVPSVGVKFAEDMIFLGYFSLDELKDQDGAQLVVEYEIKKGYWVDPCVEDQFRLIVHFAKHRDSTKTWWDFTAERKAYRLTYGYPTNRPATPWTEAIGIKRKDT